MEPCHIRCRLLGRATFGHGVPSIRWNLYGSFPGSSTGHPSHRVVENGATHTFVCRPCLLLPRTCAGIRRHITYSIVYGSRSAHVCMASIRSEGGTYARSLRRKSSDSSVQVVERQPHNFPCVSRKDAAVSHTTCRHRADRSHDAPRKRPWACKHPTARSTPTSCTGVPP